MKTSMLQTSCRWNIKEVDLFEIHLQWNIEQDYGYKNEGSVTTPLMEFPRS